MLRSAQTAEKEELKGQQKEEEGDGDAGTR